MSDVDAHRPSIYAVATMDTKGDEILFIADQIRAAGASVTVVDVATRASGDERADIGRHEVAAYHPKNRDAVLTEADRGRAIAAMSQGLTALLCREQEAGRLAGVIGIGGGGGTSLICRAMRALPIGVPKLMVSTLASGNVAPYLDCSDITLMPSIVDVAGLNSVSRQILGNAAHAISGMALRACKAGQIAPGLNTRPTIAMTMFGVTTPCVDGVRKALEAVGHECLVFHATGVGGRTMEKLVESGYIDAVLDITTTEVADEVVGGVLSAGPERMDRVIARGIPYVLSLGAVDMVNFGARHIVPERFRARKLHVHNSEVTLMRTTIDENRQIARWIAAKLNRAVAPLALLIPEHGLSMLDAPGQPFYDPEVDAALFEELEKSVHQDAIRQIRRSPLHINDPEFSQCIVDAYQRLRSTAEHR